MALKTKHLEQFVVIGLGRFGSSLAKALYEQNKDVLAIDIDEEKVNNTRQYATHTITADATDVNVLKELGITNFDAVIIAIGENMQASILVTMICKEMGLKNIITKAQNNIHRKVLEKIGADKVIVPEEELANKLATTLTNPGLSDLMGLTDDYSIINTKIPNDWIGKTLSGLKIREKFNINVLMIKRGSSFVTPPEGNTILFAGDEIVSGGLNKDIKRFADKIYALLEDD